MTKKTFINLNAQTKSQDTFIIDLHQDATHIEELFTDDGFTSELSKVIPEKNQENSSKGTIQEEKTG